METLYHPASERGSVDHSWLKTYHSFSFADYYDPQMMGYETLRVINDDTILGGGGFGDHPHKNMEIITIPLSGALEHKDSMGNKGIITKGEVQVMSAGSGVIHSEFNASKTEPVKLLQIWVETNTINAKPRYDQKIFNFLKNTWTQIINPKGEFDSLVILQDAYFSIVNLENTKRIKYSKNIDSNVIYLFIIKGEVKFAEQVLKSRDGFGLKGQNAIEIMAIEDSQVLLMEVPKKK